MSNYLEITYNGESILTTGGTIDKAIILNTEGMKMAGNVEIKPFIPSSDLDQVEWDVISTFAQDGTAGNYWSVGDAKAVELNGTVGTLTLNTTLYVYIIGINHGGENGVTWQGFKTAKSNGIDIALDDYHFSFNSYDGSKWFNMNHWGDADNSPYNTSYGGWKGCCMRYDILGSTDTAPSEYGQIFTTANVGYDASATTATNPVANTLMAALPSDLRIVMRPMTVYTDNVGTGNNTNADVTASLDYLPLLAEYEVHGARTYANTFEQNYQTQYQYYIDGNSTIKYRYSNTSDKGRWWERSPSYYTNYVFCNSLISEGGMGATNSSSSYSVSPMFLV